ncbi:MAG: GMC oxidoreductase, partial [Rhodospirillales bacterium]
RAAVRLTREVFAQQAFEPYRDGELAPGEYVQTDDEIDAFVRSHGESAYHPSCTCAMGSGDNAVVDGGLNVHGIEGLRVVDASVMPTIPSGNLNAPTIMIAEKAADIILGNPALPLSAAPVWRNPGWQTSQK